MKNIIYLIGLGLILTNIAKADIAGTCTVGHEIFFFSTKLVNSKFSERYGTSIGIDACTTATDRCHGFRERLDAPRFYLCSMQKSSGRFCKVKLIRKKDRVLGVKSWVYKTFKQEKINYGPRIGGIFSSKKEACQAAFDKCRAMKEMTGTGKCKILK